MNPILFACPQCSQNLAVAPDAAGRAVTCPQCQRTALAPMPVAVGAAPDQGPDFTETLRGLLKTRALLRPEPIEPTTDDEFTDYGTVAYEPEQVRL